MKAVNVFLIAATGIVSLHAQADLFNKAPTDVDEALRVRVNKFYQAYVDGKHRTAMPLVAEDTQDLWFDSDKPKYLSFQLLTIKYSEDFRKAAVTVFVEQRLPKSGGEFISRVPMTTTWRIDDGQWVYYVDKAIRGTKETPFGLMKAGPGDPSSASGFARLSNPSQLTRGVWLDKSEVSMGKSDEVTVTNGLPGEVHLTLEIDKCEGLTGKLEHDVLGANAKAKARFELTALREEPKGPLQARIIVKETQQIIPVTIKFQ